MYTTTFELTVRAVGPEEILSVIEQAKIIGGKHVKMTVSEGESSFFDEKGEMINLQGIWHQVNVEQTITRQLCVRIYGAQGDTEKLLSFTGWIDVHFWI